MRIVVVGNGVAGVTAALELRRLQPSWDIEIISGESDLFFSRPALMYLFMGHLSLRDTQPHPAQAWQQWRISLRRGWVHSIDTANQRLHLDDDSDVAYDMLLLATGSVSNRLGWPGQDLKGVGGFYSLQDLERVEGSEAGLQRGVIVGGGLIGIELAEMLHTRGVPVTLLVREPSYWNNVMPNQESALINGVIRREGIDLRLESELAEIVDDGKGRAGAVVTGAGERIPCGLVGLTAGVRPNLSAVQGSSIPTGRGILVDETLCSEVDNVFAAGDGAEIVGTDGAHKVWQVWYTGRAQGKVVARSMSGEPTRYEPGIWYNSAKFMDLEWHVYGQVPGGRAQQGGDAPASVYWEHPHGRRALRLVHRDGRIVGVNALGLRYRHRVCERWIHEGRDLSDVIENLDEGAFDPELSPNHLPEVKDCLREQYR